MDAQHQKGGLLAVFLGCARIDEIADPNQTDEQQIPAMVAVLIQLFESIGDLPLIANVDVQVVVLHYAMIGRCHS